MTDTTTAAGASAASGRAGTAEAGTAGAGTADELTEELYAWLTDNWDPDLTVGQWWERLGLSGWAAPNLATNAYGRGLSRPDAVRAQNQIAAFGALGAPGGLGLLLAAPTIAAHGTQDQIDTYVRAIVTGTEAWCQLFSEPGAGSDLAGLTTRAVKDGDEWVVNGQKVWTSLGQYADRGMLLARTNPDAPKHQGITWFAFDMDQDGVEVRPLREMTGNAMFNEVFLTDARVTDAAIIGDRDKGWGVANATLAFERAGLGAGGGSAAGGAVLPGSIAGQLGRRAGDVAPAPRSGAKRSGGRKPTRRSAALGGGSVGLLVDLAKGNGSVADPSIRQDLMRLHTLGEIGRFNNLRAKALKAEGREIPGIGNISKLLMSDMMRRSRDLGLRIVGPAGMLHAYTDAQRDVLDGATGNPFLAGVTGLALWAQAPQIYGGTDQIQHNVIGERVLGLPKEPGDTKNLPFSQLPKNS